MGGSIKENLTGRADVQKPNESGPTGKIGNADASSLLISCGYWDETLKVHTVDGLRQKFSENGGHMGPITCLSVGDDGGLIVTGGQDATCRVWVVGHSHMVNAISNHKIEKNINTFEDGFRTNSLCCCHILCGHETAISCIAFCSDLDINVSGSVDGVICVHCVRQGKLIRVIHVWDDNEGAHYGLTRPATSRDPAVHKLALDAWGNFVAHFHDGLLQMYTINGVRLASADAGEKLQAMEICSEGKMLITGGENCFVIVRSLHDLAVQCVLDLSCHGPIRCITFTSVFNNSSPQYMFVGTDDGKVTIVCRDSLHKQDKISDGGLPLWTIHDGSTPGQVGTYWYERRHTNQTS